MRATRAYACACACVRLHVHVRVHVPVSARKRAAAGVHLHVADGMRAWAVLVALVAALLVVAASARSAVPDTALIAGADTVENQFALFTKLFGRRYASAAERAHRFAVFSSNMEIAKERMLLDSGSAVHGITEFADMTVDEFRAARLMPVLDAGDAKNSCLAHGVIAPKVALSAGALPDSIDYRTQGAVTEVKNQGGCGSCWAFSTTGVIESAWYLKTKQLVELSEQSLVDCSHDCSNEGDPPQLVCNQGCDGGWQWNAYLSIMNQGGIDTEASYPYQGVDGTCHTTKSNYGAHIKNYTCLDTNEDDMAAYLVANGPIAIAMNADHLQTYVRGISDPFTCESKQLDHALLIVGYGKEGSRPFWIVKNSWGTGWGEKGYFRIIRGKGKCGLNNAVSSVILA